MDSRVVVCEKSKQLKRFEFQVEKQEASNVLENGFPRWSGNLIDFDYSLPLS